MVYTTEHEAIQAAGVHVRSLWACLASQKRAGPVALREVQKLLLESACSEEGRVKFRAAWWWIDRWRSSSAYTDLDAASQGLYRNLCDEVWLRHKSGNAGGNEGVIPYDSMGRASGFPDLWPELMDKILPHLTEVSGRGWTSETALEVIEQSRRRAEKQKRYRDKAGNAGGNAAGNDPGNKAGSPSPSPSPVSVSGLSDQEPTSTDSAPAATALVCPGCAAVDTLWVDDVGRWHCHSVRGCGKAFEADDRRIASQPEKSLDDAPKALAKSQPSWDRREEALPKKQRGSSDVRAVFGHWKRVMGHPDAKLTREREAKVKARLAEGYTVEQLNGAVDGCKASPHHMGRNDTGTIYDDLELICRSGGKVESFVARQPVPEPAPLEEKWTPEERSQAIAERDRRLDEMRDRAKRGREGDK